VQRPTREQTRAEFVSVAARRFAEQGFQATSLEEIAADAGYSKAALLYHFGSKDDLLGAVMDHHLDQTEELVASLEQQIPGRQRTEHAIATLIAFAVARRPTSPLTMRPVHDIATALGRNPDLLARVEQVQARMVALLAGPGASLRQQIALGVVFSGIPAVVTEFRAVPAEDLTAILSDVLRTALTM
jgi:AcrR family transcriptional regulator